MNKTFEKIKDRIIEKEYHNMLNWGRNNITDFFEFLFETKLTKMNKMFLYDLWTTAGEEFIRPEAFKESNIKDFITKYIALRSLLYPTHRTLVVYSSDYFIETIKHELTTIENNFLEKLIKLLKTNESDNVHILFRRILRDEDTYKVFHKSALLTLRNGSEINFCRDDSAIKNVVGMRNNLHVYLNAAAIEPMTIELTLPFLAQDPKFDINRTLKNESEKYLHNQAIYQLQGEY